jgi:cell division cycle 2-like
VFPTDRARNRITGEIIALKQVKVEVDDAQGFSITSLRETTLLTQLNHPNIVNVKEVVVGDSLKRCVSNHSRSACSI